MKLLLVLIACVLSAPAFGQFYAPETDFHDHCQRRFPVEAARVLAWIANREQPRIADVTYQVGRESSGETRWVIQWRDAAGKAVREAEVRYPEEALVKGPEWFRAVWRQLAKGQALPSGGGTFTPDDFWKGADGAGVSRVEGIKAALKIAAASPNLDRPADAALMSGTLVQSALPSVATLISLDGALVARGAAWLCLAEQESGASFPETWAPILTLSQRHPQAGSLWKARNAPAKTKAERGWDLLIRLPVATEALPAITQADNRRYALPVFFVYRCADLAVELTPKLTEGRWDRLYDYGLTLNLASYAREPVARDFPVRVIRACVGLVKELPAIENDGEKARSLAATVKDFDSPRNDFPKPSAELVQWLDAGGADAAGPLVPVAVATARDVNGYAWELAGLQFGTIHHHLATHAGLQQQAKPLADAWLLPVHDWAALFSLRSVARTEPRDVARGQFIHSSKVAAWLVEAPPKSWQTAPDAASVYFRRRWLTDTHRGLEYLLRNGGAHATAEELVRRAMREGSPWLLDPLLSDNSENAEFLDERKLRDEIARVSSRSLEAAQFLAGRLLDAPENPFEKAQECERLHWQTGVAISPPRLFLQYVRANAIESAKRVYDQMGAAMVNRYEFQRGLAAGRLALAVVEKDVPMIQKVARDTGPAADPTIPMTDAIYRDDYAKMGSIIDEWIKSFPRARGRPTFEQMRAYLPLLPALSDRAHPDHGKALDTFPRASFLFVQWVLIQKAGLNTDEAVRFLGGDDADRERAVMIAALRKDRKAFEEALESAGESREGDRQVLFACLRNQLLGIKPPATQPDMKPPEADFLAVTLRQILSGKAK